MTVGRKRIIKLIFCTVLTVAVGTVLALLLINSHFTFLCPFNALTSLRCPGCGNTRAALALLRFDFREAIRQNLLFPLEFFYIGWVYVFSSISYIRRGRFGYTPPCRAFDITVLALVLVWWVVRNIVGI